MKRLLVLLFVAPLIVLAACNMPGGSAAVEPTRIPIGPDVPTLAVEPATLEPASDCAVPPDRASAVERFGDEQGVFCFLYPSGYEIQAFSDASATQFRGPILDNSGPMPVQAVLTVSVEQANGRTAQQAVDEIVALNSGFAMPQSAITIGGEQGVELPEGIPAQIENRQVYVVHNGVLYTLSFTPRASREGASPELVEAAKQMDSLYTLVTSSWAFLGS